MRVRDVRDDGLAVCDGGVEVMVDLVGPVQPGDELLVHAGVALTRLQ
jgi:hydrogenase maturation factor